MLSIKLTVSISSYVLVLEIRPFTWDLFFKPHIAGFGFVLGPLGLGGYDGKRQAKAIVAAVNKKVLQARKEIDK